MDLHGAIARARKVARRLVRGRPPVAPAAYPPHTTEIVSMLTGVRWEGGLLRLTGWVYAPGDSVLPTDGTSLRVRLEDVARVSVVDADVEQLDDPAVNEAAGDAQHDYSWAAFRAILDLTDLTDLTDPDGRRRQGAPWTVVFALGSSEPGAWMPFAARDQHGSAGFLVPGAATGPATGPGQGLQPEWSETNGLVLRTAGSSPSAPRADVVATTVVADPAAGTLVVQGEVSGSRPSFELRGARRSVPADVAWHDGAFTATFPLVASDWYGDPRPLVSGTYRVLARRGEAGPVEVVLTPGCVETLGRWVRGDCFHARVERTRGDGVRLRIEPPLRDDERGAHAQMKLRRGYHAMPPVAEQQTDPQAGPLAYYECYYGVSATDSARAIHDELVRRAPHVRQVWGVADLSVPVPAGSEAVLRHSREWWQVLGSASYLTFNAGLPAGLVRRPGQVLVQTWHGTPLKLLGHDRPVNHGKAGFEESTSRYVSRWDHLLAGNPHSAQAFRSAWFYDGPVHELGYPRNDALAQVDPEHVDQVRARLGIDADRTVVLYAPTWREGQRVMPELLDLDRLSTLLGPDVVFLVRGHMNITRWRHRPEGRSVIEVTTYPEINDLFAVADVAITDYSSIMFDYSVTGKPMLFFVPDLDDYRDRRRGVYFDLEDSAPGPLLTTTDEVAEALRALDPATYAAQHGERYAAWRARFNPRDDGRAAARVVDEIYRFD
jgi:CDP-glycerol glycerophosphotransferase